LLHVDDSALTSGQISGQWANYAFVRYMCEHRQLHFARELANQLRQLSSTWQASPDRTSLLKGKTPVLVEKSLTSVNGGKSLTNNNVNGALTPKLGSIFRYI
jgi:hypothetical protein